MECDEQEKETESAFEKGRVWTSRSNGLFIDLRSTSDQTRMTLPF